MKLRRTLCSLLCGLVGAGTAGSTAATELEVTHWWTSGGEAAAVKVLADAFNAGGDTWKDQAISGSSGVAKPLIVSRIIGGKPMGAAQLNHGRQAEELVEAGLMLDLTELAEKEGWYEFVQPKSLLDSCTVNGRLYCVPINIHSFQWMWVSLDAYAKAGVAPPKTWNDFVASAPQLRDAGITPLAVGAQNWQTNGLFGVLQLGLGGVDLYNEAMINRNSEALRGDAMQAVWQAFSDARNLDDNNNSVLNWNDATSQVINGSHAAQIMGDWAQGEFQLANQTSGVDYDCLPGLGMVPALETGGDAFYFPVLDNPEKTAAQLRLASLMMSQLVQVEFNLKKGSLPVRGDIDMNMASSCMKKGLAILSNPSNMVPSGTQLWSSDTDGQLSDLLVEFWTNPELNAEDAHAAWAEIIENAD